MTNLPDSQWLKSIDFTVSEVQLDGISSVLASPGFAMSKADMERALEIAERMRDRLTELVADAKNAPYVHAPASDPASSKYIGYRSTNNGVTDINGISGADEYYRGRLGGQQRYLYTLIGKLRDALAAAEATDEETADDFQRMEESL